MEGFELPLIVYGHGFTKDSQIILSTSIGELGEDCKSDETHIKTNLYSLSNVSPDGTSAILLVSVTIVFEFEEAELICRLWAEIEAHKWRDLELNLSKTVEELRQDSQLIQANSKKKLRDNKKLLECSFAQI